tara:strand:- start:730 stop:831 length:102 start_codon:yes stop_codon:yes gene_type:complete
MGFASQNRYPPIPLSKERGRGGIVHIILRGIRG